MGLEHAPLRLLRRTRVAEGRSFRLPFDLDLHEFAPPFQELGACVSSGDRPLIETVECGYAFPESLPQAVFARLKSLPGEQYELWPADHNVNAGHHFPEPWGEATELLTQIEASLPIERPIVNHNKVSSRKRGTFQLDAFHIDAFRGMQIDESGRRTRVWRYFLNLGDRPRDTVVCLYEPELIDRHVPLQLAEGYLTSLIAACGPLLRGVVLRTPARDRVKRRIYGFKILTTHLLHCEYGAEDDFLAVVNSMH